MRKRSVIKFVFLGGGRGGVIDRVRGCFVLLKVSLYFEESPYFFLTKEFAFWILYGNSQRTASSLLPAPQKYLPLVPPLAKGTHCNAERTRVTTGQMKNASLFCLPWVKACLLMAERGIESPSLQTQENWDLVGNRVSREIFPTSCFSKKCLWGLGALAGHTFFLKLLNTGNLWPSPLTTYVLLHLTPTPVHPGAHLFFD